MDEDMINALARKYAEDHVEPTGFSKSTYEELLDEQSKRAANVIRWLSSRFCVVEKSKVIVEYKSAKHDSKMAHRERLYAILAVASARNALLESLFPDIAKEASHE